MSFSDVPLTLRNLTKFLFFLFCFSNFIVQRKQNRMTFIADERFQSFYVENTGLWTLQIKYVQVSLLFTSIRNEPSWIKWSFLLSLWNKKKVTINRNNLTNLFFSFPHFNNNINNDIIIRHVMQGFTNVRSQRSQKSVREFIFMLSVRITSLFMTAVTFFPRTMTWLLERIFSSENCVIQWRSLTTLHLITSHF